MKAQIVYEKDGFFVVTGGRRANDKPLGFDGLKKALLKPVMKALQLQHPKLKEGLIKAKAERQITVLAMQAKDSWQSDQENLSRAEEISELADADLG